MEMVGLVRPWKTEILWGSNRRFESLDSETLCRRDERKVMTLGITWGFSSSAIREVCKQLRKSRGCLHYTYRNRGTGKYSKVVVKYFIGLMEYTPSYSGIWYFWPSWLDSWHVTLVAPNPDTLVQAFWIHQWGCKDIDWAQNYDLSCITSDQILLQEMFLQCWNSRAR